MLLLLWLRKRRIALALPSILLSSLFSNFNFNLPGKLKRNKEERYFFPPDDWKWNGDKEKESWTSFAKKQLASGQKVVARGLGTYQRVINGEAKSCRGRAKSLSHGYNPVNFVTGPTLCPMVSKKIPCSLFCTRPRRDVFAGINCCFGVCLRPNRASQWANAEILPQQREKLHNHRLLQP